MAGVSKTYGYCRVSTSHQNTDRQIEALMEYGIPERDIITDKESGKDFNRSGYLTLKNSLLRQGDVLVVKELDRLGRNKQMIKEELEYFKSAGIRVKILNIPTTLIEMEGNDWVLEMVSNILIEVLSSIAEEERLKIHSRMEEGLKAARARGVVLGRPKLKKPDNFEEITALVDAGEITAVKAMEILGLKHTAYYMLRKKQTEGKNNQSVRDTYEDEYK